MLKGLTFKSGIRLLPGFHNPCSTRKFSPFQRSVDIKDLTKDDQISCSVNGNIVSLRKGATVLEACKSVRVSNIVIKVK
jgi:hypothetical protein